MKNGFRIAGLCCLLPFLIASDCDLGTPGPRFTPRQIDLSGPTAPGNGSTAEYTIQLSGERVPDTGTGPITFDVDIVGEPRLSTPLEDIPFERASLTIPEGASTGSTTVTLKCAKPTIEPGVFATGVNTLQGTSSSGGDSRHGFRAVGLQNPLFVFPRLRTAQNIQVPATGVEVMCTPDNLPDIQFP